ncbi:MAG: pyridoxal phosphate-dependent aminotransferase [Granulosicoccus sp.]
MNEHTSQQHRGISTPSLRTQSLQPSQIRQIAEEGLQMDDVIPLWFGESAWASPTLCIEKTVEAIRNGDCYYQANSGKPELRDAICRYSSKRYKKSFDSRQMTVTASGMQGLALSAQALITPGDRVVTLGPSWPNAAEVFRISGASIHAENLQSSNGRWELDLERFICALTPGTKAVLINSPNNPTGWAMTDEQQLCVLQHCRQLGIWIVADDVYNRLYHHGEQAPSFLDHSEQEDRVISVNSFSKAWSMTGWRLGWLHAPAELEATLAMLTEFNIAGPPGFIQTAGASMLDDGEREIAVLKHRLADSFTVTKQRLIETDRVEFFEPDGAFYCFFRVDGINNSMALAKNLLRKARVGLAPGTAFGVQGEGYLRLCYAKPVPIMNAALDRLNDGLKLSLKTP